MNEILINKPEDLIKTINDLTNGFVFRGQSDASWALTSSLERILEPVWDESDFDFKKFEDFSINQFSGKFHLYADYAISLESKFEKLALMQHYGAPTRLVDFTQSPYLALYFALESYNPLAKKDFSLYAIDGTALMRCSLEALKKFDNTFKYDLNSLEYAKDQIFDEIVDRFKVDSLWLSEPKIINKRLDRQAGTFLVSIDRSKRIEDAISNPIYKSVSITKYIIDSSLYESVYVLLRKASITSKSVYGDLEGLGRSVRMELVAYARPTLK